MSDKPGVTASSSATIVKLFPDETKPPAPGGDDAIRLENLRAYMPQHSYIYVPTGEMWPAASVNERIKPVEVIENGKPAVYLKANTWLDRYQPVEQMTWAPGRPTIVEDHLVSDGGWFPQPGARVFNQYRPPIIEFGDPAQALRWVDHIRRVYPDDAGHIIQFLAHRVQRPHEKINHGLVLGGLQGIGKDTMLAPFKLAIGPWNCAEVSPIQFLGRFNGYMKSVALCVSEARDLGEVDRFKFYDHTKVYAAAPPDVLRCDEKHLREHYVFNVTSLIITTNYKTDGIYLPSDDRRHFVAWSDKTKEEFTPEYWNGLYAWYNAGGNGHVSAYLRTLDLSAFDSKAPPPKTPAFWAIVDAGQAPEDAEIADILDILRRPDAVCRDAIVAAAHGEIEIWLRDRKNNRVLPHRMEKCGYEKVRNDAAKDGQWIVNDKRQAVYARKDLSVRDRFKAASKIGGGYR